MTKVWLKKVMSIPVPGDTDPCPTNGSASGTLTPADHAADIAFPVDNPRDVVICALFSIRTAHYEDRKSTRLNSSHVKISYAVFCLKKKKIHKMRVMQTHY